MRQRLLSDTARLDALLAAHGVTIDGGTSLFRHVATAAAAGLFDTLGSAGILVRNFAGRPRELRFGLPADHAAWHRLEAALASWSENNGGRGARAAVAR